MTDHQHHDHEMSSEEHTHEETKHEERSKATEKHAVHGRHTGHAVADFRKRFWISLIITVPILALSPMIQQFLGLGERLRFPGDAYISFVLSSIVFFYGGYPFLKGLVDELKPALQE